MLSLVEIYALFLLNFMKSFFLIKNKKFHEIDTKESNFSGFWKDYYGKSQLADDVDSNMNDKQSKKPKEIISRSSKTE